MKNKFYLNSQLNFFQQIHLFLSMITIRILIRKKRHNYENNLINNLRKIHLISHLQIKSKIYKSKN